MTFGIHQRHSATAESNAFALPFAFGRQSSEAGFVGRLDLETMGSAGEFVGQEVAQTYPLFARVERICRSERIGRQTLRDEYLPLSPLHAN